jgi:hypothetical protein
VVDPWKPSETVVGRRDSGSTLHRESRQVCVGGEVAGRSDGGEELTEDGPVLRRRLGDPDEGLVEPLVDVGGGLLGREGSLEDASPRRDA